MRIYANADEEKIRAQALVREWRHSGFLETSHADRIATELRVALRRTNLFLRVVLFLFTSVAAAAAVLLTLTVFHLNDDLTGATVCAVAAILCLGFAELLVRRFAFYRFGVEESFALVSVILLSIAAALVTPSGVSGSADFRILVGLVIGAIGNFCIYRRFGYVYAAIAALICMAGMSIPLELSGGVKRLAAAFVCGLVFRVVRSRRLALGDDFPGDDYGLIQAVAWAGLYLALNLHIGWYPYFEEGLLYWSTYAMTWVLPVIGFYLALANKDRLLMDVSFVMSLATLVTNKPYLHLQRKPWDPILLGVLLVASAVLIKRWLASGPNGQRRGFTPIRLLASDRHALELLSTASAAFQPGIPRPAAPDSKPDFGGGRSGGAGASGSF
jgi:hypothetical protein